MRFSNAVFLSSLIGFATAHFQLQFPTPRGPFVEDDEPTFCDGYNTAVDNRTLFPLKGGVFSLNSEHDQWTAGVLVSLAQNPTSFDNFSTTLAKPFFQATGEGIYCFTLDLEDSGVDGIKDGINVTIQVEFQSTDGKLFQCADLTLSSTVTLPATDSCTNATGPNTTIGAVSGAASATATSPAGSSSTHKSGGLVSQTVSGGLALLVAAGVALAAF